MTKNNDVTAISDSSVQQLKDTEELVKSRKRVIDHGEVFTPSWMV